MLVRFGRACRTALVTLLSVYAAATTLFLTALLIDPGSIRLNEYTLRSTVIDRVEKLQQLWPDFSIMGKFGTSSSATERIQTNTLPPMDPVKVEKNCTTSGATHDDTCPNH